MRSWLSLTLVALVATLAPACGGGEAAPKPLRYHLDDMHLASVPLDKKQAVLAAKQEYDIAQMERAKAEADLQDIATKIDIARNEAEQAKLTHKSAMAEKKASDKSADLNRQNNANRQVRVAELGKRTGELKLAFLKAKREWLKKQLRHHQHGVFAREAKLELEKARIAQQNNIRPAGFQMANFDRQYRDRQEQTARAKARADEQRRRAEARRKEWNGKEQEYLAARGGKPVHAGSSPHTPAPTITNTDNNQPLR